MNYHWADKLLLTFIILFCISIEAKVSIFCRYFGQPEFIKYQHALFKKNLLDDYELIIVEDSNNITVSNEIKKECEKFGIKYINIPRSVFTNPKLPKLNAYVGGPSFECSVSIQYVYDNYIVSSENICVIMDNDIFLISPFSVEKYLGSDSFAYVLQQRGDASYMVDYILPNFLILNPSKMADKKSLNFNMGTIKGHNTDCGGFTHFYLKKYNKYGKPIAIKYLYNTKSQIKEKFINSCPTLFTNIDWSSHYFIDNELFLHIRMGSNWSNNSNYLNMINEVNFLFDQLLD